MTTEGVDVPSATLPRVVRLRWPTWLGIGIALVVGLELGDGVDLAQALAAMAIIYLAAAVLGRPSAAWPLFLVALLLLVAGKALGTDDGAMWVLVGIAVALVGYAVLISSRGRDRRVLGQAVAVAGFAGLAIVALGIGDDLGAYLVVAGLLAHAAWDGYHHRVNKVVRRSYAEFCCVLDVLLAAAVVIVTVQG